VQHCLVGSEMCIRDRFWMRRTSKAQACPLMYNVFVFCIFH
jgi:hypothetical protein